ncbi:caprin homolog [Scaptodrosophila lebanonensis]|uniref:Caprin homolog n=1 Tax=Drosophila lebanonensis TaxID=7225 RepID=A0A6J2TEK8_DROLE|nr:caprin homolog [Scaptodrosophila lebanonensis]
MPSAATAITNHNNSKEKRASVSSIGGGVGGSVGNNGSGNGNSTNGGSTGQKSNSNTNLTLACSQTDLTNNNNHGSAGGNGSAKVPKATVAASEPFNPTNLMLVTTGHKIRNLEKRKAKLESYRAIQTGGKELSADQAAAVAKYDAVVATLEFARDMHKQLCQMSREAEKEHKKQERKDNQAKMLAEIAKIRELLVMQNVLSCLNDENVRNDLLNGENGAVKLESNEMDVLEKFYLDVQTRRPESADDVSFNVAVQKAADLYSMTINGRAKPYGELTFDKLRTIFQQIQDSGYLDKYYLIPISDPAGGNSTDSGTGSGEGEIQPNDVTGDLDTALSENQSARNSLDDGLDKLHLGGAEAPGNHFSEGLSPIQPQARAADSGELEQQQQQQRPGDPLVLVAVREYPQPQPAARGAKPVQVLLPTMVMPKEPPNQPPLPHVPRAAGGGFSPQIVTATAPPPSGAHTHQLLGSPVNLRAPNSHYVPMPTTVHAVEQNYFKQAPPPPQHLQQQQQQQQQVAPPLHQLAEVLASGSFHFLQDSELDAPELNAPQQLQHPPQLQQQPQQQQPQQQQVPVVQGLVFEAAQNHVEEPQPIQTRTFTNQSFPSLQQQQQQQQQLPPPKQQQQPQQVAPPQQQLFSPVTGQALLMQHEQRQQQQQQPMLIMTRLQPQPQQQQPQTQPPVVLPPVPPQNIGMQPGDVTAVFSYDTAVVTYEQQLQQQLGLKAHEPQQPEAPQQQQQQLQQPQQPAQPPLSKGNGNGAGGDVETNDWHARTQDTNAAATAALTNVLKTGATALEPPPVVSNKWSSEMNAVSAANANNNNNGGSGKHEWQRDNSSSGGYVEESNNHWNSSQQDNGSNGRRNSGNYQQRRSGGGDERRDGGGRGDEQRGRNGGGNYRTRNYNNSSAQQQNGRGGGGSGVYFRNNDPTGSGGNSYYQNGGGGGGGGGVYGNKESRYEASGGAGGAYRGQRGGQQRNGNGPFGRSMGDRSRNSGGGGAVGASGNGGGYINPRQSHQQQHQQQRMPLGLENKN